MNAGIYNAPGIGGPSDQPEYDGPTVDQLVTQKLGDIEWLDAWKVDFVTRDILALIFLADEDFLAAVHRMRYEARRFAESDARHEHADNVRDWEASLNDPSNFGDADLEDAA
jgi:hypothetical protein